MLLIYNCLDCSTTETVSAIVCLSGFAVAYEAAQSACGVSTEEWA